VIQASKIRIGDRIIADGNPRQQSCEVKRIPNLECTVVLPSLCILKDHSWTEFALTGSSVPPWLI
jgi:hypothetical protein